MSRANPPFQVDAPPCPTDLPFYQTEALAWLESNENSAALAPKAFGSTKEAIEVVNRMYAAGAVDIDVVVTHLEPWRIQRDGGPYARVLEVTFPQEGRDKLLAMIRSLHPDNWEMDFGGEKEDPYADRDSLAGITEILAWD